MPALEVRIVNLPQIKAAFRKAPEYMIEELNKAIFKSLINIQGREVREYSGLGIGIRTHGLINSITSGIYKTNLRGEVGPNVTGKPGLDVMPKPWHGITHYSYFVHEGTKFMEAKPFLTRAVVGADAEIQSYFRAAVQTVLNRIGEKV